MLHRLVLSIALASLVASAQPTARSTGENAESWNFAVDSDEGGARSSYMGVDIADITPERVSALKLKEEHGAEITMVDEDAPAGKAGLKEHDVILSVNGMTIESAAQLRRIIKETPPGRVVTLGLSRDGQPLTIKLQLAERGKSSDWKPGEREFSFHMPELPSLPDFDLPVTVVIAHSSMRSGLMVENITPQLGDFFGVKDGKGALVRSVEKGSHGEKAGFRAGDVIVKVNGQPVRDASDFTHALRTSSSTTASVTVIRDKHEQNLTLTLPPKKDSGQLMEDTLDEIPDFDEESQNALSLADHEIARLDTRKLQQEIARAAAEAAHLDTEKMQREIEQATKVLHCTQHQLQEQQQEMRQRFEAQAQKMRAQSQELLEQQQKLRRSLTCRWAEI